MSGGGDGLLGTLGTVGPGAAAQTGQPASRPRLSAAALLYGNPLYPLTLLGPVPDSLALQPADGCIGDPEIGNRLFQGQYCFAGHEVGAPKLPLWLPPGAPEAWLEDMHGFEWLRHLAACGGETARRQGRAVLANWIATCGHWRASVWRADVLGRRIAAWALASSFLMRGADPAWRRSFVSSLAMQTRHLSRVASREATGAARISAIRGLLYGGLCLGPSERRTAAAIRLLIRECHRQVLADGGHTSRSPRLLRQVLADLADCRALLLAANRVPPEALTRAIDRMAPMLRALCHGDGSLAAFNDGGEGDAADVSVALALAAAPGRAQANAPHMGFQRLSAGETTVIVDCARPLPGSKTAHAGSLAFEMSVGAHRLVVNCGPHHGRDDTWVRALRSTAAHSTLVIADTSSAQMGSDGTFPADGTTVACERRQGDNATWLDLRDDGYAARYGMAHHRRLYLGEDGDDLRGEDILTPSGTAAEPRPFAVRFHLHPSVQASLVMHGQAVLLRLADGSGWQLRAVGGSLALNPSVYFDRDGERRRSEQAVIVGVCANEGATVKWAIRRVAA
jgi:uncharacterized heparinase superfamily protein